MLVANRVLAEEAEALRTALEDFSNAPQPGCPWELDGEAISTRSARRHMAGPSFCAMHGIKRC